MRISVIGLGKLGAPLLTTAASRGFEVIGVDINPSVINKINKAQPSVAEPKLSSLLKKYKSRIKATVYYQDAILNSDITFVIVPTPSTSSGSFSNRHVLFAVKEIGKALSKKDKYHLIAITSTVLPFSMDQQIVPTLEKYSGKKVGRDFGVCYNPEFIALGSVIDNLLKPDFVLIGESDPKAGEILVKFYRKFCTNNPPIARMNFINAEIAKIALNSYITTKISFANTLAAIAQKIPGANVDQITTTLGLDSRVNPKYLKGSLPYGGPCFPRDNRAFAYFAKQGGASAPIAKATDLVNQSFAKKITDSISKVAKTVGTKVAILGLAYKPNTDVAEESAGVNIANNLSKKGIKVVAWDPQANENATIYLSKKVKIAKNLDDALNRANIIVITTPWNQFKNLKIKKGTQKPILVDCWRMLDPLKYQKVADYKTVGVAHLSL